MVSKQFSAKSANLFLKVLLQKKNSCHPNGLYFLSTAARIIYWISSITKYVIYFGQKQVNHNNFEMTQNENHLRFTEEAYFRERIQILVKNLEYSLIISLEIRLSMNLFSYNIRRW